MNKTEEKKKDIIKETGIGYTYVLSRKEAEELFPEINLGVLEIYMSTTDRIEEWAEENGLLCIVNKLKEYEISKQ